MATASRGRVSVVTSAATQRPGNIEVGWLLAAVGAILVLVSLFLDWFEPGLTGWTVFEALDLLLAAASLAVLAVAARSFGFTVVDQRAGVAAAAVAFVVVVSQLINHPPAATGADVEVGAWLALAGALLMLLGALMSRTGVSLAVVLDNSDRRGPAGGQAGGQGSAPDPPATATSPAPGATEPRTVAMRPEEPR